MSDLLPIDALPQTHRRYAALLGSVAGEVADPTHPAAALARWSRGEPAGEIAVPRPADAADGSGHRRPHYAGLFAYAAARAGVADGAVTRELADRAADATWPTGGLGAADDALALRATYDHLAVSAAAGATAAGSAWFAGLSAGGWKLTPDGSNPEPAWYAELALAHALASWAALTGDAPARAAAAEAAAYHQAETQPDHATGQPWAVHAALLSTETFPLADLLLLPMSLPHAGSGEGASLVAALLVADALVALRTPGFVSAS